MTAYPFTVCGQAPEYYGANANALDNSVALQAWLTAGANGAGLILPPKTYKFATPLHQTNPNFLTILGSGPYSSVLEYTGENTDTDIITLGETVGNGSATQGLFLSGFRIASSTQMTSGIALHLQQTDHCRLAHVTLDGQLGNGYLWHGVRFDQVDSNHYTGIDVRAQADGVQVNGVATGPQAGLYMAHGKITGCAVGLRCGGGFGGLTVQSDVDIAVNALNVSIDNTLADLANREIFLHAILDSATSTDNLYVNDTVASGGTLALRGWNASATRYGINIVSWPSGNIALTDGPIFKHGSDGIHVADQTTIINISIGCQIHGNAAYGLNSTSAMDVSGSAKSFYGNTTAATNNVTLQS